MDNEFDINQLIKRGKISNELELERASLAERKLRIMSKEIPESKKKREKIIELIYAYEKKHWRDLDKITDSQIEESDNAEFIVLKEYEESLKNYRDIKNVVNTAKSDGKKEVAKK